MGISAVIAISRPVALLIGAALVPVGYATAGALMWLVDWWTKR
jgi:hypothetical protein